MLGLANRMSLSLGGATNGGGVAIASRNFTTLDAAGSQYWTIPTVTLTGNFEVSYNCNVDLDSMSLGGDGVNNWVSFTLTGEISVKINGLGVTSSGLGLTADSKVHNIKITRVGTTVTTYWDGVSVATKSISGDFIIDRVASVGSGSESQYFSGVLANLKIYDAGVLVRNYAIDEADPSSIADTANGQTGTGVNITSSDAELFTKSGDDWLGAELVTNGGFDTDSDWVKGTGWTISGGTANATSTTININQVLGDKTGQTIKVYYEITSYTAGNLRPELGGALGTLQTAVGNYVEILSPSLVQPQLYFYGTSAATLSLDNVSAKRILEGA